MKIILMRHGEAERQTAQDAARQLTDFGCQQAEETAQQLLASYQPDIFVVSPYTRAQQTLAALRQQAPNTPVRVHNDITPADAAMPALQALAEVEGDCIVVVCHMSIVAHLAALLTGGNPQPFALAEARVIEADFIGADMGTEIARVVPKQP